MKHRIYVVGIGPGSLQGMTLQAREILDGCDCIVGYDTYINLIRHYFPGKEFVTTGMTKEVERCRMVRDRALQGQTVAIVSSGDAGIYGMAGIMHEVAAGEYRYRSHSRRDRCQCRCGPARRALSRRYVSHFPQRLADAVGKNRQPPRLRRCR